jgi:uncharacterized protein with PQ loop repeat
MRCDIYGKFWFQTCPRIVVYSPQIAENYKRKSGQGLSVLFVVTWLLGDLCSLIGAILANLLPTVIMLAVYVRKSSLLDQTTDLIMVHGSTPYATLHSCFRFTIIAGRILNY